MQCRSAGGRANAMRLSEHNDARAVVQRRSEAALAMPDPATRRRVCTVHTVEASSAVRSGLWFREISMAACNCSSDTNANKDSDYCRRTAAWCIWHRGKAAKTKGSSKSTPREGSVAWEGCAKRRPVCLGRHKEPAKPARKFAHSSEAISIRWRPILPSGPLPETSGDVPSDWSRKKSLRSLALRAGVLWVVVGGAQQRLDTFFERRLRCCARCCKNSATRAQLGPPNWISA